MKVRAELGSDRAYKLRRVGRAVPTAEVQRMMDINVMGTYFSYKYAAMQMIAQGKGGRIVGAASIAAKRGPCAARCPRGG